MTHVTCRLTAKNRGISSGTPRSVIEYALPLPFTVNMLLHYLVKYFDSQRQRPSFWTTLFTGIKRWEYSCNKYLVSIFRCHSSVILCRGHNLDRSDYLRSWPVACSYTLTNVILTIVDDSAFSRIIFTDVGWQHPVPSSVLVKASIIIIEWLWGSLALYFSHCYLFS